MSGKIYIGVDPSATSTGLAFVSIQNKKPVLDGVQKIKVEAAGLKRANLISNVVRDTSKNVCKDCTPVVAMEGYSMGSRFQLPLLVEVGTLIRFKLWSMGWPILIVPPTTLKKFTTGQGNVKGKGPLMLAAFKQWGFDLPQDDMCDAACLAVMAAAHDGAYPMDFKYQREAVGKLAFCN